MDRLPDEMLVKSCLQGDMGSFGELVRRYQKQVYSLAYRLTNDAEEAMDLSQEVFLKIYQVLERYDDSRPFFPWMYKVASNVCYSLLRKRPQESVPLEKVIEFTPLIPKIESQPEDYYESREIQQLVQRAIAELPEKYRVPLVLRFLEDLTYQQIAEVMELPVSTIETRLYRGKALLQKRLSIVMEKGVRRELSRC
ncbi:MAG: sigma-70 family RNA polymerase sigma factor [Syntrophomonadaceae bacterium]|nr:sigma-70 family RNA polymerase sigma factor [Syntrophomonadaceae bacterium]